MSRNSQFEVKIVKQHVVLWEMVQHLICAADTKTPVISAYFTTSSRIRCKGIKEWKISTSPDSDRDSYDDVSSTYTISTFCRNIFTISYFLDL